MNESRQRLYNYQGRYRAARADKKSSHENITGIRTPTVSYIIWICKSQIQKPPTKKLLKFTCQLFHKLFGFEKPDLKATHENFATIHTPTVSKSFQSETFQWGCSSSSKQLNRNKHHLILFQEIQNII